MATSHYPTAWSVKMPVLAVCEENYEYGAPSMLIYRLGRQGSLSSTTYSDVQPLQDMCIFIDLPPFSALLFPLPHLLPHCQP